MQICTQVALSMPLLLEYAPAASVIVVDIVSAIVCLDIIAFVNIQHLDPNHHA